MIKGICMLFGLCLTVVLTGCQTISDTAKDQLAKDVNCSTAEYDIQVLEEEKASVAEQTLAGVRSVMPAAIAIGILRHGYKDRVSVATGKYNDDIDAKIQEIKDTCGIQ